MRRRHWLGLGLLGAGAFLGANRADAAPALRVQVEQKGDFLLIGNTLGFECGGGTPNPVVGTVGACGQANTLGDSAPDIFWRSDSPAAGQAEANTGITVANARSTALLTIPNGATVTHAFLYWGGIAGAADTQITVERPGAFNNNITAIDSFTSTSTSYQSVADVTSLVQQQGSGAYRISGVNTANLINVDQSVSFAGWWMVVFYQDPAAPLRNLALFDGLDPVSGGQPQNATLSGFLVPPGFGQAKLGIATYEGDNTIVGDGFSFGGAALSNAQNPVNNFFNGTRSFLGQPVSVAGDLPQLTGTAQSMSGLDLDVVDVTATLTAGQTSAPIAATSTGDQYYLAGFVTSIPTFKPDFSTSVKTATDVNGGALLVGDQIEYSVVVTNSGTDTSVNTVLTDNLPPGVTYVPGTIQISAGANTGAKTDAAADDQCEYVVAQNRIVCRMGNGANGAQGGTMAIGETSTVKFRVTVNMGAMGTISNQAVVNAGGQQGAAPFDTPTDGNGPASGQPPTDIVIDLCASDADCAAPTPHCDTAQTPNTCVECFQNDHCTALEPTCDLATHACVCVPSGMEVCDGIDNNCDGVVDEGCVDTDMDGLPDNFEIAIGTDPNDADSDDDGVADGAEPLPSVDSDGDGLINALDPDSDNDGLFDGTELGKSCGGPGTDAGAGHCIPDADNGATVTDPLNADTDGGSVKDGTEDVNHNGKIDAGETDPTAGHGADDLSGPNADDDNDGLSNAVEIFLGTNPNDADSDDDGVLDGAEPNPADDTDGDGLINALDPDSDNDGLFDGTEMGIVNAGPDTNVAAGHFQADVDPSTKTSPINADTDGGGVIDGSEDVNHNGAIDEGEIDPTLGHGADDATLLDGDGDGLSDATEDFIGSDKNDADSDDDGVIDGQEPNPTIDTDGDGVINVLDPDSDNDGLWDGTELGKDCSNPATDPLAMHCIADADPATHTSPVLADTDGGSALDGAEDTNHNGKVDAGERDPTAGHPGDDLTGDSDGDGLTDAQEIAIGTNPNDADSDDDGVIDGQEPQPGVDSDGDGLINALDPDSDNDGLFDGTELGLGCGNAATDPTKQSCIADADPNTKTDPLDADTDDGGVLDGAEDANHNGAVDEGETDPTAGHGVDDGTLVDNDGDGLSDVEEIFIGTDPSDADSDDDGVIDGQEANPTVDSDGDGKINALDPDSDDDGLFDGTEMGKDCSNPDTEANAGTCVPDGDMGATTTSPLLADTDGGSVSDGDEDKNHNGVLDAGETDPTAGNGADDLWCLDDSACGGPMSGKVCDPITHICGNGCHTPGNGCPDGQTCTSNDQTIGQCVECSEDAQCGGLDSGKVCNPVTHVCVDGCHKDGNGCPMGEVCTSDTVTIGQCVKCNDDSQCGDATSGKVCDPKNHVCIEGCHEGGNGCPDGKVCTSLTISIGSCQDGGTTTGPGEDDEVLAEGNGLFCAARPGREDDGSQWLLPLALGGLLLARRRRQRR